MRFVHGRYTINLVVNVTNLVTKNRPTTTLFMLMSVDGKISTGATDDRDVDKDFPKITEVKEGLQQYYDIEQTTDLHSLNSGKVLAKIGINEPKDNIAKLPVSFLVIDNKPHLTLMGVDNLLKKSSKLFIITTNKHHPAFERQGVGNLEIIYYKDKIDFVDLFQKLKADHGIDKLTIQTGGTLNSVFLRHKLIDKISIVIAPVLIGGKDTPTLIDGKSLVSERDLLFVKALKLTEIKKLNSSYIHLQYEVINETDIS